MVGREQGELGGWNRFFECKNHSPARLSGLPLENDELFSPDFFSPLSIRMLMSLSQTVAP